MTATDPVIMWFDDVGARTELLGGKVTSLAELTAAGFAVPAGFGVTTAAFRRFAEQGDLLEAIRRIRHDVDRENLHAVEQASAAIAERIEQTPMPEALDQDIRSAYARLGELAGDPGVPVAVRSSGVSEDLEGASFAGQYDTYLWIQGAEDVVRHVRRCWTGLFGPQVLTYRPHEGLETADDLPPGMCVGVQQMVRSRAAGVLFTLDPLTGDRSKLVIEGCWGLGEGVVKGDVTPDRFRVDKVTLELLERVVSVQTEEYRFDGASGGVALLELEPERGRQSCLADADVIALAELGKRVERHKGRPQDLEWAFDQDGSLYLLQARPETVWSTKPARTVSGGSTRAVDRVLAKFMNPGGAGE